MGATGNTFLEMREAELAKMPLLEIMSESEFEDNIHDKYGYGLHAKMLLINGESPTMNDLDNLFNCADDED